MKRMILAASTLLGGVTVAAAADLPYRAAAPVAPLPPVMTWSGFYVGAHAGAIMDDSRTTLLPSGAFLTGALAATNPQRTESLRLNRTDGTAGGQIGYNMQFGDFVVGVETDLGRGITRRENLNVAVLPAPLTGSFTGRVDSQLDYLGTVRGRVGYAFGDFLVFGTGGFAYTRVSTNTNVVFSSGGDTYLGTFGKTETGYAYGGGVEYKITPNLSVRGEYLHYDFGRVASTSLVPPGFSGVTYTTRLKNEVDVARAAINYHFNMPWF